MLPNKQQYLKSLSQGRKLQNQSSVEVHKQLFNPDIMDQLVYETQKIAKRSLILSTKILNKTKGSVKINKKPVVGQGKQVMILQVTSAGYMAGNFALITLNGFQVQFEENENGHYRGLHIVIFNPYNGIVHNAKVFDTYKSSTEFENFIIQPIPHGFIVAAACMDDCVTNLSDFGKLWFQKMGSSEIPDLKYRCGFSFIGVIGRKIAHEKRAKEVNGVSYVTQVFTFNVKIGHLLPIEATKQTIVKPHPNLLARRRLQADLELIFEKNIQGEKMRSEDIAKTKEILRAYNVP